VTGRPFRELTDAGRIRRLRPLALEALEAWDLRPASVRFLAEHTNVMFRVDVATGERFVLRVAAPGQHSRDEQELAGRWTAAVAADGVVRVPEPVLNRDGAYAVEVETPGVPEPRLCTLARWVPGRPARLVPEHYRCLGTAMAHLHRVSVGFRPPPGLSAAVWDRAFYWPGEPVTVYDDHGLLTTAQTDGVRRAQDRVDALLAELHTATDEALRPRLIHSDLHGDNVHVLGRRLWVIDLEDVCLGTPAQDVGSALYYLRFGEEAETLSAALRTGYEDVAPWPVPDGVDADVLVAARALMLLNYCCMQRDDPGLAEFVPRLAERVVRLAG
jgi:Ser/Thr protein kinase RdoA (MazF antagonist)